MDILSCIKSFTAVAEEGSFTKAAIKLKKSKVLISRHVSQLESYLMTRLFNRTTRTLSLTSLGQYYYENINPLISEITDINSLIREQKNGLSGSIRILAPNSFSEIICINPICSFNQKYPNINIELKLSNQIQSLSSEGFDIAIRSGDLIRSDLSLIAKKIFSYDIILCASAEYIKNHDKITCPTDLSKHQLLTDPILKNNQLWEFYKAGKVSTFFIERSLCMDSAQAIKKALLLNHGVAMIPKIFVEEELNEGILIPLLQEYNLKQRNLYILYQNRKYVPYKIRLFIEEMTSYLNDHYA